MYEFAIGKLTESNIDLEAAGGLSVEKKKQKRKRKKGVICLAIDDSKGCHNDGKRYQRKGMVS